MAMASLNTSSDIRNSLLNQLSSLSGTSFPSESQRVQVKDALTSALARIQTPWETAFSIVFTQPALAATLKTCYDLGMFYKWQDCKGGSAVSGKELAALIDADYGLIHRLLRLLTATNVIKQVSEDKFEPTQFSLALAKPGIRDMVPFLYNTTLPGYGNLPSFLRDMDYSNPCDPIHTNWLAMRGLSRFDDLKSKANDMASFQNVMEIFAANKAPWTDIYPVQKVLEAFRPDRPLVVDVGGGKGHDILKFRSHLPPDIEPAKLVLQDMEPVIGAVDTRTTGITGMVHDIFRTQPVKDAAVYYLHNVLHDWSDSKAILILKNIADAMEKGYSRVLIHEMLVDAELSTPTATLDMHMMMVYNSLERSESMWRDVVAAAGLKVHKIWMLPGAVESIIEVIKI